MCVCEKAINGREGRLSRVSNRQHRCLCLCLSHPPSPVNHRLGLVAPVVICPIRTASRSFSLHSLSLVTRLLTTFFRSFIPYRSFSLVGLRYCATWLVRTLLFQIDRPHSRYLLFHSSSLVLSLCILSFRHVWRSYMEARGRP